MLKLINAERAEVGVQPLVLGDNIAAQIHAEDSLEGCYSSVWSADGLKSRARYTLAGGYQHNSQVVSGKDYCAKWLDASRPFILVKDEIRDHIEGLFLSPEIKKRLNNQHYRKVNIGLAWDLFYVRVVLLLERDYIEYDRLPAIENGILTLSGRGKNGVSFDDVKDLSVAVFYDPPPHLLTVGQIARVYSSDIGLRVAALRRPAGEGYHWSTHEFIRKHNPCPSPYNIPADAPAPGSSDEASDFYDAAKEKCLAIRADKEGGVEITVPWITASEWVASGDAFAVTADLSEVIQKHGSGLYKVVIWDRDHNGEDLAISQYVIFHGVTPPDAYNRE